MQKNDMKNDKKKLTKKPSLDYNSMSPFHAYIIKKKKQNPNLRGISKQTHSNSQYLFIFYYENVR